MATKLTLDQVKLFTRNIPLSSSTSQSPRWLVIKTKVPSADQAASVASKTDESLNVTATESAEHLTLETEATAKQVRIAQYILKRKAYEKLLVWVRRFSTDSTGRVDFWSLYGKDKDCSDLLCSSRTAGYFIV